MSGIWDRQSTIVQDLNDSQDPKNTLFCRENAFVAIYTLFQTTNVPFLPVYGGGLPKGDNVTFFYRFFLYRGFPQGKKYPKKDKPGGATHSKHPINIKLKIHSFIFWRQLTHLPRFTSLLPLEQVRSGQSSHLLSGSVVQHLELFAESNL